MSKELQYFSVGVCSGCLVCQQDYDLSEKELQEKYENGTIVDDPYFSWSACELCGSGLGGNRYRAHYRDDNDEICHLEICEDCVLGEIE
jgi:hypothetical protein